MTTKKSNKPRLCFIGFGEAGQAIASGLREAGVEQIAAWDILFPKDDGATAARGGETIGARLASSAADAVVNSDIIISAVTAGSSLDAARSVAPHLSGNPYFLDVNSVSPGRKKEAADVLGHAARYVDVAILAPIHPKRHQTPLLIAGPHAQAVMPLLIDELDMRGAIASDEVGAAAALKMIRGVMIKGIEALTAECFIAAQRAGIAPEVAASLHEQLPDARLAEGDRLQPRTHGEPRHPPRRGDGAGRRHAARAWRCAADDRGNRHAPARDG